MTAQVLFEVNLLNFLGYCRNFKFPVDFFKIKCTCQTNLVLLGIEIVCVHPSKGLDPICDIKMLRTFAQKFSNIDFFLRILPMKDDELVMSEM